MCNLYSVTTNADAIIAFVKGWKAVANRAGNLAPLPGIFPDYPAPIIRDTPEGAELAMVRWGLPSPAFALKGRNSDGGITNVRNTASGHWKRWLGVPNRCLVPLTSFAEPDQVGGTKANHWFALGEDRPLAFFAGVWVPQWTGVRKIKEGPVTTDLFAFLTTTPNAEVAAVHEKAMPVILTTPDECTAWMTEPWQTAQRLQRPLPDGTLKVVRVGGKGDGNGE